MSDRENQLISALSALVSAVEAGADDLGAAMFWGTGGPVECRVSTHAIKAAKDTLRNVQEARRIEWQQRQASNPA